MRILHTSDWHFGRTFHRVGLDDAHRAFADFLVDTARETEVDAVLIAGDVYDRSLPPVEAVALLEDALVRLCEVTRVVLTPGNHDSATRLGFGSRLFRDRLQVRAKTGDVAKPVVIPRSDGGDGLYVYALPYLEPDFARRQLVPDGDEPLGRSHEAVVGGAVALAAADLAARRGLADVPAVLMGHAFVMGGVVSESERDIKVGGADAVPAVVFEGAGFDYVALGHLHGPQQIAMSDGTVVRYAGSPVALSFSERRHMKSVALVEFSGGQTTVELIPTPVVRTLSQVEGSLDEVLSSAYAGQRDDWVRAVVTGDRRPDNLFATIKAVFPYLLDLQFVQERPTDMLPGMSREAADPRQVLEEFVAQVRGKPADKAERAVLREAYEAVTADERGE